MSLTQTLQWDEPELVENGSIEWMHIVIDYSNDNGYSCLMPGGCNPSIMNDRDEVMKSSSQVTK